MPHIFNSYNAFLALVFCEKELSMVAYDRRRFLSKSVAGAAIGAPAMAAATAALAEEPDISQLGKTPKTRFAVNVEMWWTRPVSFTHLTLPTKRL